jgi:hypothetical protein
MVARLSALRASRILPPGRFLVLISVRGWVDPRATVQLEGLGQLKKATSSRTQTGDLPACGIVPQPTMLPRAPTHKYNTTNKNIWNVCIAAECNSSYSCCGIKNMKRWELGPSNPAWWTQMMETIVFLNPLQQIDKLSRHHGISSGWARRNTYRYKE